MGAGAIQLQLRRGTSAVMSSFIGALGEITVDLTAMRLIFHDGTTAGGWPQEKAQLTKINDANYTVLPTDVVVMYTPAKTAARVVTLPPIATFPIGQKLTIIDSSNSTTFSLTVSVNNAQECIAVSSGFTSTSYLINASTASAFGFIAVMASVPPTSTATSPGGVWMRV